MARGTVKKLAIGAALAGVAGYVAGLLTAPKSGKQTRETVKRILPKDEDDLEQRLKLLRDELSELISSATEESRPTNTRTSERYARALSMAVSSKVKVNAIIDAFKNGKSDNQELNRAIKEAEKAIHHLKEFLLKK